MALLRPVFAAEFLNVKEQARAAFQKGKAFYDQGKYTEAFAEWEAAAAILKDQPVKKTIDFLKSRVDPALLVGEPPEKSSLKEAVEFIGEANSEAVKGLKHSVETKTAALGAEDADRTRREEPDRLFKEGKEYFKKGRHAEAAQAWEKLLPFAQDPSGFKERIETFRKNFRRLDELKTKANAQKSPPVSAHLPKDTDKVLSDANQKLEDQIREAEGQIEELAAKAEEELVRRAKEAAEEQKRSLEVRSEKAQNTTRAFQAGRVLFEKQDHEGALKEWENILPGLPKADGIRASLKKLSEDRERVQRMEALVRQAPSAAGSLEERVQEKELAELLKNASLRLADESRELQDRIKDESKIEKESKDSQAKIEADFRKGKDLYTEGRYADAAEAWSGLTPYLKNKPLIENMIRDVRERERELAALRKMPAVTVQNPSADRHEKELKKMLKDAVKKTDADIAGLPKSHSPVSANATQALAGRRDPVWIRSTFELGKQMHEMKRDREAFLLWGTIQPYLAGEPEIKAYIKKASK